MTCTLCAAGIDPGWKNLGIWKGYRFQIGVDLSASVVLKTDHWEKVDITSTKKMKGGVTAQVIRILEERSWLWENEHDPARYIVKIETQKQTNIPARIIATAIYAFLKAKGVNVEFSGPSDKIWAKEQIAEKLGIDFDQSKCTGTSDPTAYHNTKITSYTLVSEWMEKMGSESDKKFIRSLKDKKGPNKGDDVSEAFLYGYELLMNEGAPLKRRKKDSKSKKTVVLSSSDDENEEKKEKETKGRKTQRTNSKTPPHDDDIDAALPPTKRGRRKKKDDESEAVATDTKQPKKRTRKSERGGEDTEKEKSDTQRVEVVQGKRDPPAWLFKILHLNDKLIGPPATMIPIGSSTTLIAPPKNKVIDVDTTSNCQEDHDEDLLLQQIRNP